MGRVPLIGLAEIDQRLHTKHVLLRIFPMAAILARLRNRTGKLEGEVIQGVSSGALMRKEGANPNWIGAVT